MEEKKSFKDGKYSPLFKDEEEDWTVIAVPRETAEIIDKFEGNEAFATIQEIEGKHFVLNEDSLRKRGINPSDYPRYFELVENKDPKRLKLFSVNEGDLEVKFTGRSLSIFNLQANKNTQQYAKSLLRLKKKEEVADIFMTDYERKELNDRQREERRRNILEKKEQDQRDEMNRERKEMSNTAILSDMQLQLAVTKLLQEKVYVSTEDLHSISERQTRDIDRILKQIAIRNKKGEHINKWELKRV